MFALLGSVKCFFERSYHLQTHMKVAVDTLNFIERFRLWPVRSATEITTEITIDTMNCINVQYKQLFSSEA